MIHSLCSVYHWSYAEALKLTLPQVIMLNHAAWVEQENGEIRYEHKKAVEKWTENNVPEDPMVDEFGRPLSEMSDVQMEAYLADWSRFG